MSTIVSYGHFTEAHCAIQRGGYALTDLGPIHRVLRIKVIRDRAARTISLSQVWYIDAILARFGLAGVKPYGTPMVPSVVYLKDDAPSTREEEARMSRTSYREAIGSLMHLGVATRPDIAFAVSTLSHRHFLDNSGDTHWEAVKRIFRYLAGTRTLQLTYGGERHNLLGYTDADGATQEHRRAIPGYAFIIDGGATSWASRKEAGTHYAFHSGSRIRSSHWHARRQGGPLVV